MESIIIEIRIIKGDSDAKILAQQQFRLSLKSPEASPQLTIVHNESRLGNGLIAPVVFVLFFGILSFVSPIIRQWLGMR